MPLPPLGYRSRAVRALVLLHDEHLRRFLVVWKQARAASIRLPQTDDPDYASLDTLLHHVLRAARGYMTWMCEVLALPDPEIRVAPDAAALSGEVDSYMEHVLEKWRTPLQDVDDERLETPEYPSRWKTRYCIDAMLEHAVMHPIRHAFQLEELMTGAEHRSRDMTNIKTVAITGLVFLAISVPASAQQYAARHTGDVVQLEDTKNQTVISIVPSVGNIAFEMKVKGHNILRWPYASIEDFKAKPGMSALPFVGPWMGRLDEQAFYANGKRYAFDMELGNVRGAVPIHGFLTTTNQWQLVEARADGRSAWVTSRLDFYKQPQWMKQWPFAHTIEMTHRLQDGVLEVETKITNMSADPMPLAVGFHPYFKLTDSTRDAWTLSVPAKTLWTFKAGTKLPDGVTVPAEQLFPNPQSIALKDYNLDDGLTDFVRDPQGRAHFIVKGKQQQLDVMFGPNWTVINLWSPNPAGTGLGGNLVVNPTLPARAAPPPAAGTTPAAPDPNFIAFEPMASLSNGLNLAHKGLYTDQQYVQPGATWSASFWVKPSGF